MARSDFFMQELSNFSLNIDWKPNTIPKLSLKAKMYTFTMELDGYLVKTQINVFL